MFGEVRLFQNLPGLLRMAFGAPLAPPKPHNTMNKPWKNNPNDKQKYGIETTFCLWVSFMLCNLHIWGLAGKTIFAKNDHPQLGIGLTEKVATTTKLRYRLSGKSVLVTFLWGGGSETKYWHQNINFTKYMSTKFGNAIFSESTKNNAKNISKG